MLNQDVIFDLGTFVQMVTSEARSSTLYRGQPHTWALVPGIGRIEGASEELEKKYLTRFKRLGARLVEHQVDSDWEWLSVAQHRGLKTRLLDWTPSPLVALWFALSPHRESSSQPVVWALEPDPNSDENRELPDSPFDIKQVSIYRPKDLDSRIRAQASIFSVHPWSSEHRNRMVDIPVASGEDRVRPGHVRQYLIHPGAVPEVRNALKNCGLNGFSLFPDLEGLARTLTSDLLVELSHS
jgi:hypothetical protein